MNSTTTTGGWVPEASVRGTKSLLSSCFATMLICTWSAIHPNIPKDGESKWTTYKSRIISVILTVVIPEITTVAALKELLQARRAKADVTFKWTLKHFLFVRMGGFRIKTKEGPLEIDGDGIIRLFESRAIPLPEILEEEIEDRSKASWVTKSIALVQVSWFVAQLIGRAIQHLPVTTLELFTLGVVVCAFVTYACWWHKPYDVQTPVVLECSLEDDVALSIGKHDKIGAQMDSREICVLGGVGTLSGAVHVIAWNFAFPTEVERLLWRIGSLASVAIPVIIVGLYVLVAKFPVYSWLMKGVTAVLGAAYVILRMYLFGEMFAGLRDVPVGVYKTANWTTYIPSFS